MLRSSFWQLTSDPTLLDSVSWQSYQLHTYFQVLSLETGGSQGQYRVAGIVLNIDVPYSCILYVFWVVHSLMAYDCGWNICILSKTEARLSSCAMSGDLQHLCLLLCRIHDRTGPCLCLKCSYPFTSARNFRFMFPCIVFRCV